MRISMTKYKAEITLFETGGRKSPLTHSPFRAHAIFEDDCAGGQNQAPIGYSVAVYFDAEPEWVLGETRTCKIEFLHWDKFDKSKMQVGFYLCEATRIGHGNFASLRHFRAAHPNIASHEQSELA